MVQQNLDPPSRPIPLQPLRRGSVTRHARQIRSEASALLNSCEAALEDAHALLRKQAESHPYALIAAAAGLGYTLGGGLASRFTRIACGVGSRLAIAVAARQLSARVVSQVQPTK